MKKILLIFYVAFSIFSFTSCEEDITMDLPDYDPKLSVFCILSPDSLPTLFLSRSKSFFDYSDTSGEFLEIRNALVTITDATNGVTDTLKYTEGYYWQEGATFEIRGTFYLGKHKSRIGHKYILSVLHNGRTVTAETIVPKVVGIKSADFTLDTTYGGQNYFINLLINDPADESNGYRSKVVGNYTETYFTYDKQNNGGEIVHATHYSPRDPFETEVKIQLQNATTETASYIESVYLQTWGSYDPFSEPVMIKHNIKGGLGLFGAITTSEPYTLKFR